MRLGRLVLLAACAALPGLTGPAASSDPTSGRALEAGAARDAVPFAERFARALRDTRSGLSEAEIDRTVDAVERYSAKYELEPELVAGVLLRESSGRSWVRSPKGAVGLMQVMPHMGEPLGLAGNLATIETNVEAGCMILADNIRRLGEEDGISAYFWGSEIRDARYLEKVQKARAAVQARSES